MLDKTQFTRFIANPVLKEMGAWNAGAVALIWGTICQESRGIYIRQMGYDYATKGGAYGLIQMEEATARDIMTNFIAYRPHLVKCYKKYHNSNLTLEENLMGNLHFQVFMCRCHYLRVKEALPKLSNTTRPTNKDKELLGEYWKKYYNTELGKGTVEEFIKHFR